MNEIDDDAMADVALQNDRRDLKDKLTEIGKAEGIIADARKLVSKAVKKHYERKPSKKVKGAAIKPKTKAPVKPAWRAIDRGGKDEFALSFLLAWSPPGLRVCADDRNGRYLLCYGSQPRKSFSWTSRGHNVAVEMALKQGVMWHGFATGEAWPLPQFPLTDI